MIRLTTLGAARVHRGELAFPDLPAQRLRFALLAYLAAETDVAREDVVAMFWPDRDTARGKHALRQMLYELRGVLGDDWIELHRDRVTCRVEVDAAEFERAAAEGRTADALELYGGPFLAGFSFDHAAFEGWAERRRAHLARLHRRLQRDHIAALVAAGRLDEAVTAARRWVELDPLEDEAAHTLIERLFHSGQRTAALQYYDSYEKQLAAELQVEPIDETTALVASIRSGEQPATTSFAGRRAAPPVSDESAAQPPATPESRSRRALLRLTGGASVRRIVVAVIALVAVGIATLTFLPRTRPAAASARTIRVAVLPINDHTADRSLVSMANELTEQLTASLGMSRALEVVSSRGITLMREEGNLGTDSIGRLFSADYVVGGSVQREGDELKLSLELFDGRDSRVLRTETVRRPATQSPTLVTDVVTRAAMILREELGAQIEGRRLRAGTRNQQAFQLLVDGKDAANRAFMLMRKGDVDAALRELASADSLLFRAEQLDRRWPDPLVERAGVIRHRVFIAGPLGRDRGAVPALLRQGLEFADGAIRLDDGAAGAHEERGVMLLELARVADAGQVPPDSTERLRQLAEQSLQRAVQLEPRRQLAQRHLAQIFLDAGRYAEANLAAGEGYRADPYSDLASPLLHLLFTSSFESGEDVEAEGWCTTGRDTFGEQPVFDWCYFQQHAWGTIEPSPSSLQQELERMPPAKFRHQPDGAARYEALIAAAFARAGEPDSARAILARLSPVLTDGTLWLRAAVHVQLGENDTALTLLREYLRHPNASPRVLQQRPFYKLRRVPEFEGLAQAPDQPS